MEGTSTKMRVVVRVRPFNTRELEQNQRNIINVLDCNSIIFDPDEDADDFFFHGSRQNFRDITKRANKKLTMEYSDVFGWNSTNKDLFETCMKPLVKSVMNGYNCSVFVYGATGAGKTHTMLGNDEHAGITFLTMRDLFENIDSLSEDRKFDIGISYLEVYNEQVMNLLTKTGPLKLREDSTGVVVSGLCLKPIKNAEELIDLLILGNRNRTQHPTDANAESSRSHAVFQVHIRMVEKMTGKKQTVKLSMIDLAGSERAASTKCMGMRFKEGASINKSLLALGNCINKLADGLKHIPYRDSNLTRILKDSLGGNCQTVMIANVSPSSLTYEDTYNTLKYASRAKNIRTTLTQNVLRSNMPKDFYIKKVSNQQQEIDRLKAMVAQLEQNTESAKPALPNLDLMDSWHKKIDKIYESIKNAMEHCYNLQSKEKILKFRAKLKEHAEYAKQILHLEGTALSGDLAKLEASIDKFNKQVSRQKEDVLRWKKRYIDFNKELTALQNEINSSNLAPFLKVYLKAKDLEMDVCRSNMKCTHVNNINSLYHSEDEHWRKAIHLSCEIIQENFYLLKANQLLSFHMQEKMEKLVKLNQGQHSVKFEDEIEDEEDLAQLSFEFLPREGQENHLSSISEIVEPMKRTNSDDAEVSTAVFRPPPTKKLFKDDSAVFRVPKVLPTTTKVTANLNETQTLTASGMEGIEELPNSFNSTFDLNTNSKSVLKDYGVLADHRNNQVKKVINKNSIIKASILSRRVGLSKENRKFSPNRVKKSPGRLHNRIVQRNPIKTVTAINRIRNKSSSSSEPDSEKKTKVVRPIVRPIVVRPKKL